MVNDDAKIFELVCRNNRSCIKYKEVGIKIKIVEDNSDKRCRLVLLVLRERWELFILRFIRWRQLFVEVM